MLYIQLNLLLIYALDWRACRNGFGRVGPGRQSTMDRRTRGERFVNRCSLRSIGRWNRRGVYRFLRMRRCIAGSQVYAADSEYHGSILEPGERRLDFSNVYTIWWLNAEFNLYEGKI